MERLFYNGKNTKPSIQMIPTATKIGKQYPIKSLTLNLVPTAKIGKYSNAQKGCIRFVQMSPKVIERIALGISTPSSCAAGMMNGAVAVNWDPAEGINRLIKPVIKKLKTGKVTSLENPTIHSVSFIVRPVPTNTEAIPP